MEVFCDQGHRLTLCTTQKAGANCGRDFYTGGTQCGAFQWENMHFEGQVIKCKEKKPYNPNPLPPAAKIIKNHYSQKTADEDHRMQIQEYRIQRENPSQITPPWLQTKKPLNGSPQILQKVQEEKEPMPNKCQPLHNQSGKPLMLDYTIKQISSILVTEIESEKSIPKDQRLSVLIEILAYAARDIQDLLLF